MGRLRLASYNTEWFTALFDGQDNPVPDDAPSSRYRTSRAEQIGALGIVLTALDADGIMIIEAPDNSRSQHRSTVRALENFAHLFGLRQRRAIIGYPSDTEQEIAFLYDPDVLTVRHDPGGTALAPRFDQPHRMDLDGDGRAELLRFSKPPLELEVFARGRRLRLIGVHNKSKSPRGARSKAAERRLAIENRRKQLAECHWLRLRVESHLAGGEDLVVMGDFNDGPGLDEYERLFGQSGIELVMGPQAPAAMQLYDPHADLALSNRIGLQPSTARFWLEPRKQYFEALLDFIMVSPGLRAAGLWRIWHPLNDPGSARVPELREALLQASDHFPVTLDLTL